jgi:hypothetical protein
MTANYEMIFSGANMNPSNPIQQWVKLILINEPIPTHLMNYTFMSKGNDVNCLLMEN